MVLLEHSIEKPLNREPRVQDLISSFLTTQGGYDRNHGPTPHLDGAQHRVTVDGAVPTPQRLSMADLRALPQHRVTCALQCAGNRRHTMRTRLKEVDGIDWGDGAVMNCRWHGPRLRDVLRRAGVTMDADRDEGQSEEEQMHVAFACHQTAVQDDGWYGGSIELWRALRADREVILALEMNGTPLTVDHGAPVRVVAPGVAGARSVKWLDRITVQREESTNFYQRHDYKILPPEARTKDEAQRFWDVVPALADMPVNSVIGVPESGETVRVGVDGSLEVRGYALPQGADGPVVRVEVSSDEGASWADAELALEGGYGDEDGMGDEHHRWCWVLWRAVVTLVPGTEGRILSRATDRAGNVQAANPVWNLRGVGYNGYGESRDLTVVRA
ncbi:MAG: hypothetical protein M1818_008506 [Claussenomyces sp. TS43310]|nr:MAG: hypothetical protein M1818_008506 [Claussenomyces sp. TS43310]